MIDQDFCISLPYRFNDPSSSDNEYFPNDPDIFFIYVSEFIDYRCPDSEYN